MTVPTRRPPSGAFETYERAWRPSLAWVFGAIVAIFGLAAIAYIGAFVFGAWRAVVTGQSMPLMTGGIEQLIPALLSVGGALGGLLKLMGDRSHEVRTQYWRAGEPAPQVQPSAPSSGSSAEASSGPAINVNPHGGPDTP